MSKEELNFDDLFNEKVTLESGGGEAPPAEKEKPEESSLKQEDFFGNKNIEFTVGQNPDNQDEEDDDEPNEKANSTDENDNSPSSDDTEDASGSFALAFAKFQQDEGVISEYNEDELKAIVAEQGEVGALRYLLDKQADALREETKQLYAADKAELEEYFALKDAGVDPETAKELALGKKQWGQATEDDVETDEDFRKEVLIAHLKATTNFTDVRIKKMVENSFSLGEDVEEAKEALKELKVLNEAQIKEAKKNVELQAAAQATAIKTAQEDFKKFVNEQEEFIKGVKINKPTKDKIVKMILEPAAKNANGEPVNAIAVERAKDPKKFDAYLAFHLVNGTFYGNMDSIKKKVKTDVTTDFEEKLRSKNQSLGGKPTKMTKDSSVLDEFFKM
jgi:hypothetical protein